MGNVFEVKGEMSAKQQKRDIAEKSKIKGEFTQKKAAKLKTSSERLQDVFKHTVFCENVNN